MWVDFDVRDNRRCTEVTVYSLKHLNDGFVSYKHTAFGCCGLLWSFYQLFGLSFWRHPFTAEHPLLRHWCNATFLQIWWRNKLILILDGLRGSKCSFLGLTIPLRTGTCFSSNFDFMLTDMFLVVWLMRKPMPDHKLLKVSFISF